ncbi:MAG: hypothetical protein HC802_12510 [Caldilineaceae bacterium]|nr:hypothetical protein [Caldilineaceae bacterium]
MGDVYMLGQREQLCSLSRWQQVKEHDKLLIVTSLGLARPYPMRVMLENIEAPVPLIFDNQLLGVPVLVAGAEAEDELLIMTETGRAVRTAVKTLRGSGTQVIRADRDNRVVGVALCQPDDELLLVTGDGYGRQLLPRWIELPEKENSPGQSAGRPPQPGGGADGKCGLGRHQPAHPGSGKRRRPPGRLHQNHAPAQAKRRGGCGDFVGVRGREERGGVRPCLWGKLHSLLMNCQMKSI